MPDNELPPPEEMQKVLNEGVPSFKEAIEERYTTCFGALPKQQDVIEKLKSIKGTFTKDEEDKLAKLV